MRELTIERGPCSRIMDTIRISGFADGELEALKAMEHGKARDKLLLMLDDRNNGIATTWHNGYGIFGLWFDNEYAYLNVGRSCD